MYVVAEKKKEFHIQRRKKIGRPCLLDHIQCFFFFGVKFCTVATKTRIQCEVYKGFLWEKIQKICHTCEGKKKSEVYLENEFL